MMKEWVNGNGLTRKEVLAEIASTKAFMVEYEGEQIELGKDPGDYVMRLYECQEILLDLYGDEIQYLNHYINESKKLIK